MDQSKKCKYSIFFNEPRFSKIVSDKSKMQVSIEFAAIIDPYTILVKNLKFLTITPGV